MQYNFNHKKITINGSRYLTANDFFFCQWGHKIRKISVDIGRTCPNRDGRKSNGGCVFCSETGSGSRNSDIAGCFDLRSATMQTKLVAQIEQGVSFYKKRYAQEKFLVYFQAFTPTYGPIHELVNALEICLAHPQIHGFVVASRADCFTLEIAKALRDMGRHCLYWVELGLQSIHDKSLSWMNRQETHSDYLLAQSIADQFQIPTIAHLILGLPTETKQDLIQTARFVNQSSSWGVKIHQLHPIPGTPLWPDKNKQPILPLWSLEDYLEWTIGFLEYLRSDIVVHRVVGDYKRHTGVYCEKSNTQKKSQHLSEKELTKDQIISALSKRMQEADSFQGKQIDNECQAQKNRCNQVNPKYFPKYF